MHYLLLVIIFVTSRFFSRGSIVEEITGDSWSEFSGNRPKIVKAVCRHQLGVCSRVSGKIGWPHLHINVVQNNEIPMTTFWVDLHTFSKCVFFFCSFAYVRCFHVSGWRYNPLVIKVGPNIGYTDTIARQYKLYVINPLNPELNPICYLLALLAHHFLHVSRIRVKSLTLRLLMSYIWSTHSWCF